jgi:hypothetical protein
MGARGSIYKKEVEYEARDSVHTRISTRSCERRQREGQRPEASRSQPWCWKCEREKKKRISARVHRAASPRKKTKTRGLKKKQPTSVSLGHSLDGVLLLCDVHDGNTGNLPDAALQVTIAGANNVALVLGHTFHQAVIGVGSLVRALQDGKPGIAGDAECTRKKKMRGSDEKLMLEGLFLSGWMRNERERLLTGGRLCTCSRASPILQ